jgi:hypothetical protein
LFLAACATAPKNNSGIEALSESAYGSLVKKHTVGTDQYSGFYQTFQADMTILTSELQTEILKQRAQFMQWDQRTYQSERDKMLQESGAYSKFFLRFYSPEHEYDDLHKGKTIWKVYLDYGGSRFEGKVRKMTDKFVELKDIFPHLDRFSTPYEITFNVPMTTVEGGASKVTLTSSLGSAEFKFPAAK